jgi:hypothetical protein
VAALPLGEGDTEVMLDGIAHFRPLLNGDSGFMPRPYDRAMELLEGPLTEEGLRFLRAVGVRHVLTRGEPGRPAAAEFADERILEVPEGSQAEPVAMGTPTVALWTGAGIVVDLGAVRPVGRVSFVLDDRPWIEAPGLEASSDGLSWQSVPATASLADATLSSMRDPRHARGELRFATVEARLLRLDPRLPAAPQAIGVSP